MIKFAVYGEPQGKARPRFNTRTKTAYTTSKTAEYEREVAMSYRTAGGNKKLDGAVAIDVTAYFAIPKSTPKKKLFQFLQNIFRPIKKPDIDNILKIIMDGLNGIAYDDDKQVVSVKIHKFYSTEPRVEVEIDEVN